MEKDIEKIFADTKGFTFFQAPGRINIIGEHTDYNGGYVLPAAIDKKITVGVRKSGSNTIRAYSKEYNGLFTLPLPIVQCEEREGWVKHLKAVILTLRDEIGFHLKEGLDIYITGNIPVGAGLSSSAALDVALTFTLNHLFSLGLSLLQIARFAQKAESEYVGVRCGIMDQFISVMGKKGRAILLNTSNMDYEYVPLALNDMRFVLFDTNVHHELRNSKYNLRRSECERGLKILQKTFSSDIKALSDVTEEQIRKNKGLFSGNVYKRLLYVVQENHRVLEMVKALKNKAYDEVGRLLYASHNGLKYLYEVSSPELDLIVDHLRERDGVIGGRMMGGGFGGCVLALIYKNYERDISDFIEDEYYTEFKRKLSIYPISITDGIAFR